MLKNPKVLAALALALVIIAVVWFMRRETAPSHVIDLVAKFAEAEKRTTVPTMDAAFSLQDVTIDGQTKKSIFAHPHSRIIYTVTVPPNAWLETSFALRPDSWDRPGDGAQFRVGVSEGRTYDELLRQYVNPKRGDRRWFSARLDLSAYEGRQVKVIMNTDPGPPGDGNSENDWAVWGAPQIYSKK
jgi:hypothetical protein